jgi:hypothetical protein
MEVKKHLSIKHEGGQSYLELAIVIPILVLLILGTVEVVSIGRTYLAILEASAAGARLGANGMAKYDNDDINQFAQETLHVEGYAPEGLIDVIITRADLVNGTVVNNYNVEKMLGSGQTSRLNKSYLASKINAGDPSIGIIAVEMVFEHEFLFSGTVFLPDTIMIRAFSIQGVR